MNIIWRRIAIITSTAACMAVLSINWSEGHGVVLGVEGAQARETRASAAPGAAALRRRPSGRTLREREMVASVVAATTTPRNYDDYDCYQSPYAGSAAAYGYYHRSYPGGYCVSRDYSSALNARPTLLPRYYAW